MLKGLKQEPEYGTVSIGDIRLESGVILPDVHIAYERAGPRDAPIIVVCHTLTGNQHAVGTKDKPGWWSGLIGPSKYIDTLRYSVITMNVLGGCNGSTGPTSINPKTEISYRTSFPFFTVRDIVHTHHAALRKLGINHVKATIGGSLGGMQVLEWGLLYPDFMDMLLPLAVTPVFNDYALAFNAISRQAIIQDHSWNEGNYTDEHLPGLEIARMVGMVTYRSPQLFNKRFQRTKHHGWGDSHHETAFAVESYITYQGKKITTRFDANSYLYLLKAMDSHDISRGRGGWHQALRNLKMPIYAIGYSRDLLYPAEHLQEFIYAYHQLGKQALFEEVDTIYGHDGFLTEYGLWGGMIQRWLA